MEKLKNPYRGVNPHLNSWLQRPGTGDQPAIWPSFHASHIAHLAEFLNLVLPDGYIALNEQSLQIRGSDFLSATPSRRPKPDITVFRQTQTASHASRQVNIASPTWQGELINVTELEDFVTAIVIRPVEEQTKLGKPVVRIELLSPSNKPGGSEWGIYRVKRAEALQGQLPLVEIDYLHESLPVIPNQPIYPQQTDAFPYNIAITDPRKPPPQIDVFSTMVDSVLPVVPIPLAGQDSVAFELEPVYQSTYERGRWGMIANLGELPTHFETYSPDDQARIRAKMEQLAQLK